MKFKKDFPGLKYKEFKITSAKPIIEGDLVRFEIEAYFNKVFEPECKTFEELSGMVNPPDLILTSDIQENCKDNQRIREALKEAGGQEGTDELEPITKMIWEKLKL